MRFRERTQICTVTLTLVACLGSGAQAKGPLFVNLAAGAHDAGTVSSNPAGMLRLEDPSWRARLIGSYSESTWEVTSSGLGASSESESDNMVYVPSLAYARPLGERWAVGASLSVTSGLGDDGEEDSVSRYLSTDWSIGSFTLLPSLAYQATDELALAASVGINYTRYSWEAAVFNGIGEPDGEVEVEPDDVALNFVVSALWTPSSRTRFGLSYRSEYEPSMEDTPEYSGVDPDRPSDQELELDVTLPQSVLAGVHHSFANDHWLSFDLLWIDTSAFALDSALAEDDGGFAINPYQLNDTWILSAGWGWPVRPRWEAGLGVMYVHDPIDDEDRSVLLRVDSLWGLGATVEHVRPRGMTISAGVSYLFTGDAEVETRQLPVVGVLSGEYVDRTNWLFELSMSW